MKKVLALLMSTLFIFTALPVMVSATDQTYIEGDFRYTLSNNEATIVGITENPVFYIITAVPDTLGGYPVVAIGSSVFRECSSITSIKIPEGVRSIGESAFFRCLSMASIEIPESVTSISDYAFDFCPQLTNVHYTGATKKWESVTIGECNDALANIHCGEYITPATCSTYPECDFEGCSYIGTDLGHTYDDNCDTQCNICEEIRTITHDYQWVVDMPADCGNSGLKHEECTVCGDKRNQETLIPATGLHTYEKNCKDGDCNVCGQSRVVGEHKYDNDCDKTCDLCDNVRTIKHTYKTAITTAATLKINGATVKKCSVCGYVASNSKTTVRRIYSVKLSTTSYTYNGKVKTPTVTVKDTAGKKLVKNTDYAVKLASGRKKVGTYKVTVTFKGKYSGTKTLYFKINPAKTTVSKLIAGKKSLKVYITKKSAQVTGYEVQYSTSKTFKSAKTKTFSSYKTTSTTLSKLSAKKTYYVRVRTYKTVNGTKYYSGWSSYKYKKTK